VVERGMIFKAEPEMIAAAGGWHRYCLNGE
jgi:hypothetical protein